MEDEAKRVKLQLKKLEIVLKRNLSFPFFSSRNYGKLFELNEL